jgi:hypothetical protein
MAAGAMMVYASTASGPILMALLILTTIALYGLRRLTRHIVLIALAGLLGLNFIMNDPVYFLVARIDVAGGSTGWHRAQLIRASIEHLNEWWLAGTDYTRHWMPTGIPASGTHTDLTNHFLAIGVMGGLAALLLFAIAILLAFRSVGAVLRAPRRQGSPRSDRLAWALGAVLFGLTAHFLAIALFDQSIVVFYLVLAAIGALTCRMARPMPAKACDVPWRRSPRVAAAGLKRGVART